MIRPSGCIGVATLVSLAVAAAMVVSGCSSNTPPLIVPAPSAPVGLPTPPAPGSVNTYFGVQSPGTWTFTLDNTKNTFSYQPMTYPAPPNSALSGTIQAANGFTVLASNGTSAGYALEMPGRFAILRPGGVNTEPVLGVPQTSCYQLTGRSRFQYIAIQAGVAGIVANNQIIGNGSVVASTDSTGKSWQFENMQGDAVAGPASFSGTCGSVGNLSAISFTGQQSLLNILWAPSPVSTPTAKTNSTISIGPSGLFVADQSDPTLTLPTGASVAGVMEPASALSTTDIGSKQYLGFVYQGASTAVFPASPAITSPVSFGAALTGGEFPNDDVTQTPNSDMAISLGKQDLTYNGLYMSVAITVADPAQNCANYTNYPSGVSPTSGVNALGYNTCTFSGVAVVGNPEGKYAIFVTTYNWAAQLGGAPMQMYLLQQ